MATPSHVAARKISDSVQSTSASMGPASYGTRGLGMLNKQVAAELQISEITVKAHRGKVIRKMGSNSLADLVKMAARLGRGPATRAAHAPSSH